MSTAIRPEKNLAKIETGPDSGSHNFPCPVCNHEQALLDIAMGYQPCFDCRSHGWRLLQLKKIDSKNALFFWFRKMVLSYFFEKPKLMSASKK